MIPPLEMSEHLAAMARSTRVWLSDFSSGRNARPAHEVEVKTTQAAVLEQASLAYAAKAKQGERV